MQNSKKLEVNQLVSKFSALEAVLTKKPWFKKQGWQISFAPYPRKEPEGVTLHVFKRNWFNEDGRGIHVESYISLETKKKKAVYVTLHLLHHPTIPGTKIKRIELARHVIDTVYSEVNSWKGYKFRAGKYGQQPFTKLLDVTNESFQDDLELEVSRICQRIGPVVDCALKEVLKN